jgi:hypothetical protein
VEDLSMSQGERAQRRAAAAAELSRRAAVVDAARVVDSLADGLNTVRDLFFTRVRTEVESRYGMDSMLSPASAIKSEAATRSEIDVYQVVEAAAAAGEHGYLDADDNWRRGWLARLRLGDSAQAPAVVQRLDFYAARQPDDRRRAFSLVLERAMPEARRAPLIVYRLLPLAVAIATNLAFADHRRAQDIRRQQIALLPGIADCRECRGNVIDNGEKCPQCGNPFWKHEWLTAD